MIFLKSFHLLPEMEEYWMICQKKNIFNSLYPLKIFPEKEFEDIDFETITIFYGGNGSGKTTLLNIIADKLEASRKNHNKLGELFDRYVSQCDYELYHKEICNEIKFISSDDVFDYLLDLRAINSNVNRRKDELSEEYLKSKYEKNIDETLEQYEILKRKTDARKMTQSKYIRSRLVNNNLIQQSNGESAIDFWQKEIQEKAIYLIDEPENSLSAENQLKLKHFIEEAARFYDCQFIISTHSPFLLSLEYAKIYDLDSVPVKSRKWAELPNVRTYYQFFKEKEEEFMNSSKN
ncbi:AAA family ATPase [Traorella massiliensis]|uniref:AAA family ATPase n=1 Tax=Traorella massiliensis TaxID=1903263 RepID=UPI00235602B5|nr:AAA family ATPase [Traorella massiliensis]